MVTKLVISGINSRYDFRILTALSPTAKKVALAPTFSNSVTTQGVIAGCGPSSKVRYTTFSSTFRRQVS